MIKFNKKLFLIPILAIGAFLLASCGGSKKSTTGKDTTKKVTTKKDTTKKDTTRKATTSSQTTTEAEPDYKKSERAMENFKEKLSQYNYTVNGNNNLTTSVVSEDKVIFKYGRDSVTQSSFAVMTVNNETFQASIVKGHEMEHLRFLDDKPAAIIAEKQLPSYLFDEELTHHTIWEYFLNVDGQPYHFIARSDDSLKELVGIMCGLDDTQIHSIRNITLDFDKEDVSVATFNAEYYNGTGTSQFVPLTITITLGSSESDSHVDAWMNDTNREYPAPYSTHTKWHELGDYEILLQSATKIHENIDNHIPYLKDASYAVVYNGATFLTTDKLVAKIRDYHGTQDNVDAYVLDLLNNYNYEAVEVDGVTHYRRFERTRDEEECYIDIQVELDNGFYLVIGLYYTGDTYRSLAEYNTAITEKGFIELPDTHDLLTDFDGLDYTYHAYESHTCLLDWKLYAIMTAKYTSHNAVNDYIDNYAAKLEAAGYTYDRNDDAWIKSTRAHKWFIGFTFRSNNTLEITAKVQDFVDPALIKEQVEAEDFPTVDMTYETDAKNLVEYMKFQYGQDCSLAYEVRFLFDTAAESKQFIDDYNSALEAAGFIDAQTDPESGMRVYENGLYRVRSVSEGTFAGIDFYKYIES